MRITRRGLLQAGIAAPAPLSIPQPTSAAPAIRKDHDLTLPAWGPYTKKYYGISHLPSRDAGLRFDLSLMPGFFRRTPLIPSVLWESGYHPWDAAPDLSFYSSRFELEWKGQVFADISFAAAGEDARLVTCQFVNRTSAARNLALHLIASLHFPFSGQEIVLPEGAFWIDSLDYDDLRYARPRPSDGLVYDAMLRGEIRDRAFVNGSGIGRNFGRDAGDSITYTISLPGPVPGAVVLMRYRGSGTFRFEGIVNATVALPSTKDFASFSVPTGSLTSGRHSLRIVSEGGAAVELDGFAVAPSASAAGLQVRPKRWRSRPRPIPGPTRRSILLHYPDLDLHYGLAWDFDEFQIRELLCDDLDIFLRFHTHQHVRTVLEGQGDGHYTDVFLRPVPLPANSTCTLKALLCAGSRKQVESLLAGWRPDSVALSNPGVSIPSTPAGEKYVFSQQRMAATTLTNVVYPIYFRRSHIKHNSPGHFWDSLYTWDSGFIGLGLLELDLQRALDCLCAYLTESGDPQAAFVHHGTPIPVQVYLFQEIWNRTQSRELLAYLYPRVRQMHQFLAGRYGNSTTRRLKSQLLTTWDYFYNTGWDDYPPQQYVHAEKLESVAAPVVITAHAIRSAKVLRQAAHLLGHTDDIAAYDEDIREWTAALQRHSWDEESGYFGYVLHDEQSRAREILRHPGGLNYNMGLCGAYPLVAGICTHTQQQRLLGHLMSEEHLWTRIGLSTVDRSAPYYRKDGYWNGAVWFPHQWFFWRALLDMGRTAEARRIAMTALDLWRGEVDLTYNCFEHFLVETGRGAGWHHFSALSTPVLMWFGAYFRPGRITTGFDALVERRQFASDLRSMTATLAGSSSAIVTLTPGPRYRVTVNGVATPFEEPFPGVLETRIAADRTGRCLLEVSSR